MDIVVNELDRFSHVPHVRIGSSSDVLPLIHLDGVNLVIWERPVFGTAISAALEELTSTDAFFRLGIGNKVFHLPEFLWSSLPTEISLTTLLTRQLPGLEIIAPDIKMLFSLYSQITKIGTRVRTETRIDIKHGSSELFHTDYDEDDRKVRLITTCYGDGTDWLEDAGTAPYKKGVAAAKDSSFVHNMSCGDVAIMRGGYNGIFHRTPAIKVSPKRVVVIMDAVI